MTRFSDVEINGLKEARVKHPKMAQRELARDIYDFFLQYDIEPDRSIPSIYAALRRVEANAKVEALVNA